MAYGPQGIMPDYSYQAAMQGRNQPSIGAQIGKHALGGLMGALGGGIGAYGIRQGILQQQAQQQQQQQPSQNALPQVGAQQQPMMAPQPNSNDQLAMLLQQLTSQKVDNMTALRAGMAQPQPQALQQQAYSASQQQMGQQGPPQWGQHQPGFAFDQYTGQQDSYNPLAALADLGAGALEETDTEQPWWRQGAHGLGKVLQGAAPLAGALGPLGWLGGAAAGLTGYGLQQI